MNFGRVALCALSLAVCASWASAQSIKALTSTKQGRWEVKVTYPVVLQRTPLAGVANPVMQRDAQKLFGEFTGDAVRFDREGWMGPAWSLSGESTLSIANATLISAFMTVERYTGGANAAREFVAWNFGRKGQGWGRLTFEDLLLEGTDLQAFFDQAALAELNVLKVRRGADPLEELPVDSVNDFVITKSGITWLFDKGEVGSGAEGVYVVKVPWSEMPDGLNPTGPIGGLLP